MTASFENFLKQSNSLSDIHAPYLKTFLRITWDSDISAI